MGTWILRLAGFALPKKLLAILGLGAAVAVGASYSLYKASVNADKVIALSKALERSEARITALQGQLGALEGTVAEQAEVLKRHAQVKEKQNAAQTKVRQAAAGSGPVDHARVQRAAEEARRALRSLSEPRQGSSPTRVSGTP